MILVKDTENFKGLMKMCKNTDLIKENSRTTFLELEQKRHRNLLNNDWKDRNRRFEAQKDSCKIHPRFLSNEKKLCRLATCEDMLEMTRTDPEWKGKIITGDETWVYGYDPETKRQYAEWRGQVDQLKNGASGSSLARKYGVGNATISDIKKNSDAITNYASALDNEDGSLYRKAMKMA
ncbi:hypothetical protein LAZ67_9001807 [Cordylochernes scorpioides]|uniref:HTH psq-type domain-containing protein n=1 Tax=Cordylochernes scorpioides TaxID=51811 RepID=A0ABY6KTZ6_9ARAC|nr:hypothetical protein LAZ67_9001807 [Cordylochernes scorpioides]